jgi:hypothetical protein
LVVESGARTGFICAHETTVANNVGSQDRRKSSLDAFLGHFS